jgi:hypothetical protein
MGGGGACAALLGDPHVAPIVKCAPKRRPSQVKAISTLHRDSLVGKRKCPRLLPNPIDSNLLHIQHIERRNTKRPPLSC